MRSSLITLKRIIQDIVREPRTTRGALQRDQEPAGTIASKKTSNAFSHHHHARLQCLKTCCCCTTFKQVCEILGESSLDATTHTMWAPKASPQQSGRFSKAVIPNANKNASHLNPAENLWKDLKLTEGSHGARRRLFVWSTVPVSDPGFVLYSVLLLFRLFVSVLVLCCSNLCIKFAGGCLYPILFPQSVFQLLCVKLCMLVTLFHLPL